MIFNAKNMFTHTENKSLNFGLKVKALFIKLKEDNISEGTSVRFFFSYNFLENYRHLKMLKKVIISKRCIERYTWNNEKNSTRCPPEYCPLLILYRVLLL